MRSLDFWTPLPRFKSFDSWTRCDSWLKKIDRLLRFSKLDVSIVYLVGHFGSCSSLEQNNWLLLRSCLYWQTSAKSAHVYSGSSLVCEAIYSKIRSKPSPGNPNPVPIQLGKILILRFNLVQPQFGNFSLGTSGTFHSFFLTKLLRVHFILFFYYN